MAGWQERTCDRDTMGFGIHPTGALTSQGGIPRFMTAGAAEECTLEEQYRRVYGSEY